MKISMILVLIGAIGIVIVGLFFLLYTNFGPERLHTCTFADPILSCSHEKRQFVNQDGNLELNAGIKNQADQKMTLIGAICIQKGFGKIRKSDVKSYNGLLEEIELESGESENITVRCIDENGTVLNYKNPDYIKLGLSVLFQLENESDQKLGVASVQGEVN